jgi:hypothetical protein
MKEKYLNIYMVALGIYNLAISWNDIFGRKQLFSC